MAKRASSRPPRAIIARNKQAFRNYAISDRLEAGIVLLGSEVKSLRAGKANLTDAYAEVRKGEVYLINCHISAYSHATHINHEPMRPRKLLLHRQEIERLAIKIQQRGFTLVPLELYFFKGRVKVELGLGKGKALHDKRATLRERDQQREVQRAMRKG